MALWDKIALGQIHGDVLIGSHLMVPPHLILFSIHALLSQISLTPIVFANQENVEVQQYEESTLQGKWGPSQSVTRNFLTWYCLTVAISGDLFSGMVWKFFP